MKGITLVIPIPPRGATISRFAASCATFECDDPSCVFENNATLIIGFRQPLGRRNVVTLLTAQYARAARTCPRTRVYPMMPLHPRMNLEAAKISRCPASAAAQPGWEGGRRVEAGGLRTGWMESISRRTRMCAIIHRPHPPSPPTIRPRPPQSTQ